MSRQTYQKYENGNMSFRVDTAWKFAAICKISFDSIIFFKGKYTSSVS
ncbi:helix-turn-helix transcriptional regulator [Lactiplantibacillus plantarum]